MTPHHLLLYYLQFESVSPEVAPGSSSKAIAGCHETPVPHDSQDSLEFQSLHR